MRAWQFRWLFGLSIFGWIAYAQLQDTGTLGLSAEWSNGNYRFAGGTEPWALGFAGLFACLYILLMNAAIANSGKPLRGLFRRFVAFWLDFCGAMATVAPVVGILVLLVEWRRTRVFAWTFARTETAATDVPLTVLTLALSFGALLFYYAVPLVRQRPSPGACIMGYQVVPDGPVTLTLRRALLRTSCGFLAVCGAWCAPFVGRDSEHGKFWPDKVFHTRATLLE